MRSLFVILLIGGSVGIWAQNSQTQPPSNSQAPASTTPAAPVPNPKLAPPRSDSVSADALPDGESSSKDTQGDLTPPPDDDKAHPKSSEILTDESASSNADVREFHPWNPHKAAKDIEVGDFYFKRKNYRAAEDRYREALFYKDNDALATFRLAVCLEKMDRTEDARAEYESYLKILPHGPLAEDAKKAIERLKGPAASAKPAK